MSETATRTRPPADTATRLRSTDRVTAFDEDVWTRLSPGMMVGHGWLRALDEAARDECPLYLALEEGGRLTAAAVLREVASQDCFHSPDRVLLGRLRRPLARLGVSFVPCLLVGPHKDCDPALFGPRRAELLDRLLERARERGLPLVFRRVPATDSELQGLLRDRGFLATLDNPVAYMDIAWSDFDGYLEALRARSPTLPSMVRREIRVFARSGIEIREIADPEPLADRLHGIALAHHRRLNPDVPYPYGPRLLPLLRQHLGERCIIFGAFAGRELVGFAAVVHDGRVGHLSFCGFLPETRGSFLYFNMGYYLPVRRATELGLRRLYGGILQHRLKARRGFDFLPTRLYFRGPGGAENLVARPVFRLHRWVARRYKFTDVLTPS